MVCALEIEGMTMSTGVGAIEREAAAGFL